MEDMQTGVCLYASSGLICGWTKTAERLTGFSSKEMLDQKVDLIFNPASETLGPQSIKIKTKNKGLQTFTVEVSDPLEVNGQVIGVITFLLQGRPQEDVAKRGELLREPQSGVYDGQSMMALLNYEARMTFRYQQVFSILLVQIDNYKDIDSRYGAGSTDLIVQTLAIILKNETRDVDCIGRMAEDLFLVCLPSTKEKATFHVAARISKVALRYSDDETPFTIKTFCSEVRTPIDDWMTYIHQMVQS